MFYSNSEFLAVEKIYSIKDSTLTTHLDVDHSIHHIFDYLIKMIVSNNDSQ